MLEGKASLRSPFRAIKGAALNSCRYLSWDDYFMAVAFLSAQRSKDPNKQVPALNRWFC